VSFQPSDRHRFRWEVRPSFSVSQNLDRSEVIYLIQKTWKCGFIRPDRSDKTLKYEVRSIEALTTTVVPHFRRFPLMSAKQADFENFAEVCEAVNAGRHLTPEGFERIARLAFEMNPSGKRKYLLDQILNALPLPGCTFELPTNLPHSERYSAEGATYWVARRNLNGSGR